MKKDSKTPQKKRELPALTAEARENQLVAMAMDLAEQRMREGKATSQEIVYFLRAGSPDERLKRKLLDAQAELAQAKKEALQSQKRMEELYANALRAMTDYSGEESFDDQQNQIIL